MNKSPSEGKRDDVARNSQENITKRGPVIWRHYQKRLHEIDILFKFVRYAFDSLSLNKRKEFVANLKAQELERNKKTYQSLTDNPDFEDMSEIFADMAEDWDKQTRRKYRNKVHTQYSEWVSKGMISAEILFRFTLFEDFLKHVHAAILCADPKILAAANPKRPCTHEELFSRPFEEFRDQQICREVEEVDRKKMKDRLAYFVEFLGVDLGPLGIQLIEVANLRNRIAHGYPLDAITQAIVGVPLPEFADDVARTIHSAMSQTYQQLEKRHPPYFRR